MKKAVAAGCVFLIVAGMLAGCGSWGGEDGGTGGESPFYLSIGAPLIGELPPKNNAVEQAIEAYTHTDLQIQWIPLSAYDDKLRLMIASGEMPKLIKISYSPTYIATMKAEQFWELGPLLKEYPSLSALDRQYYDNISVEGRIYGIPIIRELGRAVIQYRKDWFDALGLQLPVTLEDWYRVVRAMTLDDPDGNGKRDTYGMVLEKRYNQDVGSLLTRISVSQGGPNKWLEKDGRFTPEFMTKPFLETMKMFRRLYQEKLINSDFAVVDTNETARIYDSGRAGIQINGGNAQTWMDKLGKTVPDAAVDVAPLRGPAGIRLPGEAGNAGFFAIPKDSVKTLAEVKKILQFLDKLLEPPMQTVIGKGVENRHWKDAGAFTEVLDRTLDLKEVKPYRDMLLRQAEESDAIKPSSQPELFRKSQQINRENRAHIVDNPALTLESDTFAELGKELDTLITDAETKFIMGLIDEAGWEAELAKWRQAGGERVIHEYEEAYSKRNRK
ncbi:extracellular solute-binding protein [Paenibacillus sp. YN15]|uniref:extracellular solute-binding protein n=1 Tax=Paenibacillus sp. YN15 TaxID=1742774 RepID=UPI000DCBD71C|nr:extracellular solute-binding protein [Paenibacillus sp. YN15]RAU95296.1 ABC transporter substrate-binding protein [Paenibacillus sp. YN15]